MTAYRYVKSLSETVHVLYSDCGAQVWTLGLKRGRAVECEITKRPIEPGTDCYRPIGNAINRMARISETGLERLKERVR